jgi:hypothetical protein
VPDKREFIIDAIMSFLKSYNPVIVVGKSFPKNKGGLKRKMGTFVTFNSLRKVWALLQEKNKSFSALVIIPFANNHKFAGQNNI